MADGGDWWTDCFRDVAYVALIFGGAIVLGLFVGTVFL